MATTEVELTLGERLALVRKRAGHNQTTLGRHLGVSKALIGFFETGDREPSIGQLVRWAELCGVDLDWLAGRPIEQFVRTVGIGYQLSWLNRVHMADVVPIQKAAKRQRKEATTNSRCSAPLPAQTIPIAS